MDCQHHPRETLASLISMSCGVMRGLLAAYRMWTQLCSRASCTNEQNSDIAYRRCGWEPHSLKPSANHSRAKNRNSPSLHLRFQVPTPVGEGFHTNLEQPCLSEFTTVRTPRSMPTFYLRYYYPLGGLRQENSRRGASPSFRVIRGL